MSPHRSRRVSSRHATTGADGTAPEGEAASTARTATDSRLAGHTSPSYPEPTLSHLGVSHADTTELDEPSPSVQATTGTQNLCTSGQSLTLPSLRWPSGTDGLPLTVSKYPLAVSAPPAEDFAPWIATNPGLPVPRRSCEVLFDPRVCKSRPGWTSGTCGRPAVYFTSKFPAHILSWCEPHGHSALAYRQLLAREDPEKRLGQLNAKEQEQVRARLEDLIQRERDHVARRRGLDLGDEREDEEQDHG